MSKDKSKYLVLRWVQDSEIPRQVYGDLKEARSAAAALKKSWFPKHNEGLAAEDIGARLCSINIYRVDPDADEVEFVETYAESAETFVDTAKEGNSK